MKDEYLGSYLNGLMNMASSNSKYIGPSSVEVDCFKKEEFNKYYKIDISPTTLTFEEQIKEWFGDDKKVIESIIYWTNNKIKDDKKIYHVNDKDYELFRKYNPFYSIDDIFVLETKDYLITYVLGNNE